MTMSSCILIYFNLESELVVRVNRLPALVLVQDGNLSPHPASLADRYPVKQEPWSTHSVLCVWLTPFAFALAVPFVLQRKLIQPLGVGERTEDEMCFSILT